jgi:serine/threonine-protein kinase
MNLSVGLERIINQCTALEPDKRYQNCQELLAALAHYNEAGGRHRQKQHFKWTFFLFFLSINVLVLSGGLGVQKYRIYQQHQKYEQKINISTATPYETRVTTYLEAIDLVGADTRAYLQLLDAYTENGCFGDEQSSEFSARFNAHKNEFLKDSEAYLQLLYKVGITYFYLYSGGDGSFRTRVLKSYPYFEEIVISEQEAFDYYGAAESYYMIGRFYAKYIVNATSIKEPTKEAYTELLSSLSVCMENIDHYHFDDAAYVRLTMYREIANLLNDHRRGLAATGIAEKEVQTLLERIRKETETLSVTQQISIELKESLLAACDMYMDNVHRVYFNIEWRGEQ